MKGFFKAIKKGDIASVSAAIEKDVALANAQDKNGFTPLMWAAHKGHFEIAKLLITHDANVTDIHKETGSAVIHLADDFRCDVNAETLEGDTPAHIAVKANNLFAVKTLST